MYVSFQQKMGMLGQNVLLQFLRDVMNVPVHISRHNNGDVVLLEPHRDLEALQLCAARCCVQVNSSQAFIRLINPTFEQVQTPMNFSVANVVEINQGEIVSLEGGGSQYYQCSTP